MEKMIAALVCALACLQAGAVPSPIMTIGPPVEEGLDRLLPVAERASAKLRPVVLNDDLFGAPRVTVTIDGKTLTFDGSLGMTGPEGGLSLACPWFRPKNVSASLKPPKVMRQRCLYWTGQTEDGGGTVYLSLLKDLDSKEVTGNFSLKDSSFWVRRLHDQVYVVERPKPKFIPPPIPAGARIAELYVCDKRGKRQISYDPISDCQNRGITVDPDTAPSVPLFLSGEPELSEIEKERLQLLRSKPDVRGACVVRINPAAFDAHVIETGIDGKKLKFQVWSNDPGGSERQGTRLVEVNARWLGGDYPLRSRTYQGSQASLQLSHDLKNPASIHGDLRFEGRYLQISPMLYGGTHLVLTEFRPTLPQGQAYAVDVNRRALLEERLLREFPDEATFAIARINGDAITRALIANAPEVEAPGVFDVVYEVHLPRLQKIWAGASPGFIDPSVPKGIEDKVLPVTLDRPCSW